MNCIKIFICNCFVFLFLALNSFASEPNSIRLGLISPLSGEWGAYGQHIKEGVELAQSDLEVGGLATKIFYEDACLPVQARGAVTRLISVDRIDGLVGSYCVVGLMAAAPLVEKSQLPSFHTSIVPQEMLDTGSYIFTTNARISDEAKKAAEYAFNQLKARKAAILYLTTQWGEEYQHFFAEKFSELGGEITGIQKNPIGGNDTRSQLTLLKKGNPDVLFIANVGSELANALKQARILGVGKSILSVNEAEEKEVVDIAKEAAEGLQFFVPEPREETTDMKKFSSKFIKRFRHKPHALARQSYDATILLASALSECDRDRRCVANKLYQVDNYSGASGVFSIQKDGGTRRSFILKVVKNGRFVRTR